MPDQAQTNSKYTNPRFDKRYLKLLRSLDFANDQEAEEVWKEISLSPIDMSRYFSAIFPQLQNRQGRLHLGRKAMEIEHYSEYLELFALHTIGDKHPDIKTFGFRILSSGRNINLIKRVESCLTSRDKKTRIEADRCTMAIELGHPFQEYTPRKKRRWFNRFWRDLD